jgi:hypothetical protein
MLDEEASIFKVLYLHGEHGRRCGGHKREGECVIPGEVCPSAVRLGSPRGGVMGGQKSAEGIVAAAYSGEGPNMEGRQSAADLDGRRRRRKDG